MDINTFSAGFELSVPNTVQSAFYDKVLTDEVGGDFTLPDYQSEMRKLLRVTPRILPPARFLGAGEAEFAGNILFTLLYTGTDGGLYTAQVSTPYTFRIPLPEEERRVGDRPVTLCFRPEVDGVTPRLTAPRKLSLRCRLRAHILGLSDMEIDPRYEGEGGQPERREQSCTFARTLSAVGEASELVDEFVLPAAEGEARVIGTEAALQITEAIPTEGSVALRGEVYLKTLLTRESVSAEGETVTAPVEVISRRLPFARQVEIPLAPDGFEVSAAGECTDISARVEEGKILCCVNVVPTVCAQGREKARFVCDCYSTERPTKCDTLRYAYHRPLGAVCGNVTASGTAEAAALGMPSDAVPLDLVGHATVGGVSVERGHVVLSGECHYQLLWRTAQGEMGCSEVTLPLRYEVPGERRVSEGDVLGAEVTLTMLQGRALPQGEGLAIDAEWAVAATLWAQEAVEAVDCATFEGSYPARAGVCRICYLTPGESLWQVGKRYHAPLRALCADNDLPGAADAADAASLEGVAFLVV